MAEGWGMAVAPVQRLHEVALRSAGHELYLARAADGTAAGAAASVLTGTGVFLSGAVVLPAYRRQGLYQALVAARLAGARAAGKALAFTHARADTSAPLLLRAGFEELSRFQSFRP
jgi:GNAT superfamily N-acetyltransferase